MYMYICICSCVERETSFIEATATSIPVTT